MNKVYSTLMMLALMVAALSFSACSGDDDDDGEMNTSALIGTWDFVYQKYTDDYGVEEIEYDLGYWVFTKTTVTIHDKDDYLDGETINYSFDGKKLSVSGYPVWTVVTLTNTTMVLKGDFLGTHQEARFNKRK